jgi:hypothetical protein
MWVQHAHSRPPAYAAPLTAAIVGLLTCVHRDGPSTPSASSSVAVPRLQVASRAERLVAGAGEHADERVVLVEEALPRRLQLAVGLRRDAVADLGAGRW